MTTFETTCRQLEQFLFAHYIHFASWHKNEEGFTVWVYDNTEEVTETVAEFDRILAKHGKKRRG